MRPKGERRDFIAPKLGRIVRGRPETINVAFGGDAWKTLYFTNWYYLGAAKVTIRGPFGSAAAWPMVARGRRVDNGVALLALTGSSAISRRSKR